MKIITRFSWLAVVVLGMTTVIEPSYAETQKTSECCYPPLYSVPVQEPEVLLTFDDGPSVIHTPRILDVLKKYGIRAIFFVLGERAEKYPDIVDRIVQEDHVLAHHSWDHRNYAKLSKTEQMNDMRKTCALLENFQTPIFFRTPYGTNSAQIRTLAHQQGMRLMLWSIDSLDWQKPSKKALIAKVTNALKPGAIILLHDIHKSTAEVLEALILAIRKKGYRFYDPNQLTDKSCH